MREDYSRILIRATNWVGDAVMCLPALAAIRSRFPKAHISILARPWVADLYERGPFADEVLLLNAGIWKTARRMRALHFDCAILLQNAFAAALIAWLAGIPRRIGYNRDGRGFLLTDAIAVPRDGETPRHERFYYLELLRRAGIIEGVPSSGAIELPGAVVRENAARENAARENGARKFAELGLPQRVVGVSPGAAFGGAKRWLPDRFSESAARIASELGAGVAVFGSESERRLGESVADAVRRRDIPVHNFAGATTLREFIQLAAACEIYLTNDSGAMHISSALGVPTVAVFGATDYAATGPTGAHSRIVREPVECSPCLLRECPIDHRCMTRVTADRVVDAALALLRSAARSR